MSATDRTTTRTVVRARYDLPEYPDHFVVETLDPDDDPAARLAYWRDVPEWTDLHVATETTTVTYTRIEDPT